MTETEIQGITATLRKGITASPVLSAFGVNARANRGRFYIERQYQEDDSEPYTEIWGRITPLAGAIYDSLEIGNSAHRFGPNPATVHVDDVAISDQPID